MTARVRGVSAARTAVGIDVEGVRQDVDEHRRRAEPRDAAGGGEERIGGGDDFVAAADAERHQDREQRVGAGRHRMACRRLERAAELGLELLDLGPEDEPLAVADALDGGEQLAAERPVLRLEIEQRNGGRRTIGDGARTRQNLATVARFSAAVP